MDGTWDPPVPEEASPDVSSKTGSRRSVGLPSFPFPGRDSNRKMDLIEGSLSKGSILSGGSRTEKGPSTGSFRETIPASFGIQGSEPGMLPGNRITTSTRSPGGLPALRTMEDPGFPEPPTTSRGLVRII
ncbi:MAG: hypothetical protein ACMUHY_02280 [Thermoplasmatota archaeon]